MIPWKTKSGAKARLLAVGLAGGLLAASESYAAGVTPFACPITQVTTGGTAVTAIPGPVNGGIIWNLTNATDPLFVNQTGVAITTEGAGNFPLVSTSTAPSPAWYVIPSSRLGVSVNAADNAHAFGCLYW